MSNERERKKTAKRKTKWNKHPSKTSFFQYRSIEHCLTRNRSNNSVRTISNNWEREINNKSQKHSFNGKNIVFFCFHNCKSSVGDDMFAFIYFELSTVDTVSPLTITFSKWLNRNIHLVKFFHFNFKHL